MNKKIKELLKAKKDVDFKSLSISNDGWKRICENLTALQKKQEKENEKLEPSPEMMQVRFTI